MKQAYYQFLNILVLVRTDIDEIIYALDRNYRFFKKNETIINNNPDLELIVSVKNNDIKDLNNFEIYALTPLDFDGWQFSVKVWANVDLKDKYVKEVISPPIYINLKENKRLFQIKMRVDEVSKRAGWLLQIHFHINLFVLQYMSNLYMLHGGCLEWEGKGIILNGISGSGKSTLTYALAKAGFRYLTDESILLDPETLQIFPYPIAPSFDKGGSINLFSDDIKEAMKEDEKLNSTSLKCFLDISKVNLFVNNKPVNPDIMIFPKYLPDKKPEFKKLSNSEAIHYLTTPKNVIVFLPPEKQKTSIKELTERLVERAECYYLISNQLDRTIELVKEIVYSNA